MLPAYAGMILGEEHRGKRGKGAPRVCGDDPLACGVYEVGETVLPAYAGMILDISGWQEDLDRAPRVCGDDPMETGIVVRTLPVLPAYAGMIPLAMPRRTRVSVCSPRMRG